MGQVNEIRAILFRRENVEGRVVIPGIAPLLSARAKFQLRFLFCRGFRIGMGRSEQDAISPRLEKSAGRFPRARRDARRLARFQVENVLLVKRIFRFAFALENQLLPVRRKITFTAPLPFKDELARVRQEPFLLRAVVSGEGCRAGEDQEKKNCKASLAERGGRESTPKGPIASAVADRLRGGRAARVIVAASCKRRERSHEVAIPIRRFRTPARSGCRAR
jgi:hypothetical protein